MSPARKKQLKAMVDDALKLTNGQMPITLVVRNAEEEETEINGLLKKRKHGKVATRRSTPSGQQEQADMTQPKTYSHDFRIRTTIRVITDTEAKAEELTREIVENLELVDHARDGTLDISFDDGPEFLKEKEEPEGPSSRPMPASAADRRLSKSRTR